ncbi:MAG: DUF3597 domain-containing protein [Acetobacteraceae bacterium]
MSLFGSIMSKIFGGGEPAAKSATTAAQSPSTGEAASPPQAAPSSPSATATTSSSAPTASSQAPAQPVDVEAVLTKMASEKGGGGNWQTSIVDLLKLLDLDSSLSARKELANELNVHAGADGSAEQNMALQKAVMQQLAANGGKVPESLKS